MEAAAREDDSDDSDYEGYEGEEQCERKEVEEREEVEGRDEIDEMGRRNRGRGQYDGEARRERSEENMEWDDM